MTPIDARANPLAGNPLKSRSDLQQAVRDLVAPLLPYFSEGAARVRLGSFAAWFPQADAELEGFARPLWGLAPLAAGGGAFEHWGHWVEGIRNGTDPRHPECWIRYEAASQTMVEQAAIGFALLTAPEALWEPLDRAARDRLVEWLSLINRYDLHQNNWQFFRVLVNLGLEAVGRETDEAAVDASLDLVESYYRGDGWYADGVLGHRDHYVGWAFHAYGLVYARARPADPRSARFRERARRFAEQFEPWFDDEGGVIPFGRSLTYRFAAASFWSALAFADEQALPWGRIRGLLLRHLRWWSRWPISDRDGVLSVGYGYANPWMREEYNSAGSPYWALKAFLCLALPESHPFWQAAEEPLPARADVVEEPEPGMLLSRERGQAIALSGGHDARAPFAQGRAKYGRLAYSSAFPLGIDPEGWTGDSTLVLRDAVTGVRRSREEIEAWFIRDGWLYSRWRPFDDVTVHTLLSGRAPWHLRCHRIVSGRALETSETGFALGLDGAEDLVSEEDGAAVSLASTFGRSTLVGLEGGRLALALRQPVNTNLAHPYSAIPWLGCELAAGVHDLACAVGASRAKTSVAPAAAPALPSRARELLDEMSETGSRSRGDG